MSARRAKKGKRPKPPPGWPPPRASTQAALQEALDALRPFAGLVLPEPRQGATAVHLYVGQPQAGVAADMTLGQLQDARDTYERLR